MDNEFLKLAKFFNHMTDSLKESVVTREELEHQIIVKTAQLEAQKEKLQFLSEHDSLTGLQNRFAFEKSLNSAIVKADRSGLKLALLFIDLDKFKQVNDTKGHDAGAQVVVCCSGPWHEELPCGSRHQDMDGWMMYINGNDNAASTGLKKGKCQR